MTQPQWTEQQQRDQRDITRIVAQLQEIQQTTQFITAFTVSQKAQTILDTISRGDNILGILHQESPETLKAIATFASTSFTEEIDALQGDNALFQVKLLDALSKALNADTSEHENIAKNIIETVTPHALNQDNAQQVLAVYLLAETYQKFPDLLDGQTHANLIVLTYTAPDLQGLEFDNVKALPQDDQTTQIITDGLTAAGYAGEIHHYLDKVPSPTTPEASDPYPYDGYR